MQNYSSKLKNFYFLFSFLTFILLETSLLIFALLTFNLVNVSAQEKRSAIISPPTIEHRLNPDDTASGRLKITNNGSGDLSFVVSIQDFIVEDSKGTPTLLPPNTLSSAFSASSWLGVSPSSFSVKPKQTQEIEYFLNVPKNARAGGHYAAILFNDEALNPTANNSTLVQAQIGALLLITVPGDLHEEAQVIEFKTPRFQEYGPIPIQVVFENLGDLHIQPIGVITLTDVFGRTLDQKSLTERRIFPKASREHTYEIGPKIMIGPVKATLLAAYGTRNNLPLTASATIWIFPWKESTVIILLIIACVLGVIVWRKQKEPTSP